MLGQRGLDSDPIFISGVFRLLKWSQMQLLIAMLGINYNNTVKL